MSSSPRSHSLDFGPISDITGNVTSPPVWSPAPGMTPGHRGQLHSCPVPAHRQHHDRVSSSSPSPALRTHCTHAMSVYQPCTSCPGWAVPCHRRRCLPYGCHPSGTHRRLSLVPPSPTVRGYTHSHPQACTQPPGALLLPPAPHPKQTDNQYSEGGW